MKLSHLVAFLAASFLLAGTAAAEGGMVSCDKKKPGSAHDYNSRQVASRAAKDARARIQRKQSNPSATQRVVQERRNNRN